MPCGLQWCDQQSVVRSVSSGSGLAANRTNRTTPRDSVLPLTGFPSASTSVLLKILTHPPTVSPSARPVISARIPVSFANRVTRNCQRTSVVLLLWFLPSTVFCGFINRDTAATWRELHTPVTKNCAAAFPQHRAARGFPRCMRVSHRRRAAVSAGIPGLICAKFAPDRVQRGIPISAPRRWQGRRRLRPSALGQCPAEIPETESNVYFLTRSGWSGNLKDLAAEVWHRSGRPCH